MNRLCTRHIDTRVLAHARQRLVIVGAADLEALALEDDAIEGHCLCRFVHWTKLYRGKNTKVRHRTRGRATITAEPAVSEHTVQPQGRQNSCLGWSAQQELGSRGPEWGHPGAFGHWRSPSWTPTQERWSEWTKSSTRQTGNGCKTWRGNFSCTHEPLWYQTGCCRRTADGPAGSSDCPRLVLGWVWQPGHQESWWAGGLSLESVPQLEGEKGK